VSVLAIIRPDDWNLALFTHVLGALSLVGALVLSASYLVAARRDGSLALVNASFRSLLYAAVPAYIVMRVGAEWIYSKEKLGDLPTDPDWVGVGYMSADIGFLLIIISTVAAWLGLRRARANGSGAGTGLTVASVLIAITIVAYLVAIWAMTTKPGA
jgi:hypothetical protein